MKKLIQVGFSLLLVLGVIGGFYSYSQNQQPTSPAPVIGTEAKAIEAIGLKEFASDLDVSYTAVSPHDKAMYQEIIDAMKISGDGKDKVKNQQAVAALGKVIDKYPSFSETYILRATLSMAAGTTDYHSVAHDIDSTIKYRSEKDIGAPSIASIYGAKAKVDFQLGDFETTLNDLDTAVKSDLSSPNEAFNTGGVKAEDTTQLTVLSLSDFNLLAEKFPTDYRTYMYRGLFFGSFSFYDTKYYAPAIDDLKKAVSLNPSAALPYYFLGNLAEKLAFNIYAFPKLGNTAAYDKARDIENTKALEYFKQAITADPRLKEAYASVAEELFSLKQYADAIPYYDKAIELDPNNAGLYNDRGLAKTNTGNSLGASSDLSDAIRLKHTSGRKSPDTGHLGMTYQNRADAYIKSSDYANAIDDLTKAIGLKFSDQILITTISAIRSIYPEFKHITDIDLIEGLRQKYFPNMTSTDFLQNMQKNSEPYGDFILSDLYVARGDAYIKAGDFKKASLDYARAVHNDSAYAQSLDRWKKLSVSGNTEYDVDIQTLDFSQGNSVSLWIKIINTDDQSYSKSNFELNCSEKKIKSASAINYGIDGAVIGSIPEQDWSHIVPETIGETIYNAMCGK